MTFCAAFKVRDGLVGIADTRVTTGTEQITARKVTVHQHDRHSMFMLTSGLRSARDKALTYFEEVLEEGDEHFDKLYKMVNAFARQVRRVADEDRKPLAEAGLDFNLCAIVGGQLERDDQHKLYLLYPQGNWVEVGKGHPYFTIGESSYAKPVIDRTLAYDTSMEVALKIAYLGFNAARASATVVDFPIDVVLYRRNSFSMVEHRYEHSDLVDVTDWWQARIRESVEQAPSEWLNKAMSKLPPPGQQPSDGRSGKSA